MPPPTPGTTGGTIPVGPMSNASGENRSRGITPQTHMIAGGCDTCGVCHPNRCFECDAVDTNVIKEVLALFQNQSITTPEELGEEEEDRAVRAAEIVGTWMN